MIRRWVSAALLVRDGFTGQPLSSGGGLLCRLDGRPIRPLFKEGGYLVLTDLAPGVYTLTLGHRGFLEETVTLDIREGALLEETIPLRPGPDYPFQTQPVRLTVCLEGEVPQTGAEFWAGVSGTVQLKLAQGKDAPLGREVRLFCKGASSGLPIPGWFLVEDGEGAELVHLQGLERELGRLESPMAQPHPRGTELVPMWRYRTGPDGTAQLLFRREGKVYLFCAGQCRTVALGPGAQELRWKIEE